jgi:hypothetical protein
MGQFAIFSQPHFNFEAGPFDSQEDADKHISRVLSNISPGDKREFLIVSLGRVPASGRRR